MECTNPIICSKHGVLVSLNEHCNNLFRFFQSDNPYDEDPIRDWFKVCSGIRGIDYVEGMFDDTGNWCRPAFEYDEAVTEHLGNLVLQLTWFTYIWGGFEAFVDDLNLPNCPTQRGKINNVTHYLKASYENDFKLPAYYKNLLTLLENYLKITASFNDDKNIFKDSSCSGISGKGITIVYKIRNKFAHGGFQFGEPDEYSESKGYHSRIIHTSCRIVLITIQMMLVALYRNNHFYVEKRNETLESGSLHSEQFLLNLHLRDYQT